MNPVYMCTVGNIRDKIHFIFPHGERGFYLGIQVPHKEAAKELLMTRPLKYHTLGMYFWQEKNIPEMFKENKCNFSL